MAIRPEAETSLGGYQCVDVGEAHDLDLAADSFEYQLCTPI